MTAYPRAENFGHWWLTTWTTWDRLHAVPGDTLTVADHRAAINACEPVRRRTACGREMDLTYAGLFSRFSMPRCAHCCRKLGIPPGHGTPCNDETLKDFPMPEPSPAADQVDEQALAVAAQTNHEQQDELRNAQLLTAAGQVAAVREVIAYARVRAQELRKTRDAEPSHRWEDRAHEAQHFADRLTAALDNAQLADLAGLPHSPMIAELRSGEWGVHCLACSDAAQDYVPRCLIRPEGWPPLVLRDAPPSTLLEARAQAAADQYGARCEPAV